MWGRNCALELSRTQVLRDYIQWDMRQHVLHLLGHFCNPVIIWGQTLDHETKANRGRSDTWEKVETGWTLRKSLNIIESRETGVWRAFVYILVPVWGALCLFLLMCSALSALVILVGMTPSSPASSWNERKHAPLAHDSSINVEKRHLWWWWTEFRNESYI